jgi:hypothetical protein
MKLSELEKTLDGDKSYPYRLLCPACNDSVEQEQEARWIGPRMWHLSCSLDPKHGALLRMTLKSSTNAEFIANSQAAAHRRQLLLKPLEPHGEPFEKLVLEQAWEAFERAQKRALRMARRYIEANQIYEVEENEINTLANVCEDAALAAEEDLKRAWAAYTVLRGPESDPSPSMNSNEASEESRED